MKTSSNTYDDKFIYHPYSFAINKLDTDVKIQIKKKRFFMHNISIT